MKKIDKIIQQIINERKSQDAVNGKWYLKENTHSDWIASITKHLGMAVDENQFSVQMIRVAALAVAAIEYKMNGYIGVQDDEEDI